MALIKVIGNDNKVKLIPKSFYDSYLKKIGYRKYVKEKASNMQEEDSYLGDNNLGENGLGEDVDVESIPIGEMTGKQVKQYAEIKGIDVSAAKSTKEAKDIIRKYLSEEAE